MKNKDVKGICFICKKPVTTEQMNDNQIEMVTGPDNNKVFVHNYHSGVADKVNEEYKEVKAAS